MLFHKKCYTCGKDIPNERDVCEECMDKVLKENEMRRIKSQATK